MNTRRAFTLIELLCVVAIMALTAAAELPGYIERKLQERLRDEDAALAALKADIVASFDRSDNAGTLQTVNLACTIDDTPSLTATGQTASATANYTATTTNLWFAKIAAMRGTPYTGQAPTAVIQPQLAEILYNSMGRTRMFLMGPPETDQQRFIILSVMGRAEALPFPDFDGSDDYFDAAWTTNWNTKSATPPAYIWSLMGAQQQAQWLGASKGYQTYRVRVIKITLRKHPINASDTHPTDNLYICWNDRTPTGTGLQAPLIVPAGSGAAPYTPYVFAGRRIVAYVGTTAATAKPTSPVTVREATDIVCQPNQ